jgi:hypothetical protein
MELADQNLQERCERYRQAGQPGIPRLELLRYLRETAEVLDLMNRQHHLQHLDIKPHNLFLVSNHIKVGDFGLVSSVSGGPGGPRHMFGAITPLYASPELFQGKPSRFSDQYSLAIVYQELLTGHLPFQGKNARQLLLQHTTEEPDLEGLPPGDRRAVACALAKKPKHRFASCMDFVAALLANSSASGNLQFAKASADGAQPQSMARTERHLGDTDSDPKPVAVKGRVLDDYRRNLSKVFKEILAALGVGCEKDPAAVAPSLSQTKDVLRYKFRAGLPLATARGKLDAFCSQCFGQIIREDDRGRGFSVPLPSTSWSHWHGRIPALEVQVILDCIDRRAPVPIDVAAEVRVLGCSAQTGSRLLREMGLPLLESLRAHLLVQSEQPVQQRVPWTKTFQVRPLQADGTTGDAIRCRGKDISLSGIGFILPNELDASEVLIEFPSSRQPTPIDVPATLVRARRCADGMYEVGALFRLPGVQSSRTPQPVG